jgi:hypothetical protein
MEGKSVMIKNFTKLLANWILCLIVSFISSANAADDTVAPRGERRLVPLCESKEDDDARNVKLTFYGGTPSNIHEAHRSRLLPLVALNNQDSVDWGNNLQQQKYLKSNDSLAKISEEFRENYGSIRGHDTEEQAALASWERCDKILEVEIIFRLRSYIEKEGFPITPEMLKTIRDTLNPSQGTVKPSGEFHKFYILTLDKTRLFKFHLTTTFSHSILSRWTCYTYTAKMTANLDIGIYEFLGN